MIEEYNMNTKNTHGQNKKFSAPRKNLGDLNLEELVDKFMNKNSEMYS